MREFDFENLSVYQRALDFTEKLFKISEKFPIKTQSSLGDQLRRAGISIVNNIAEGSNKRSKKEKAQFFSYSLESARECVPMITISERLKYMDDDLHNNMREECVVICKMLSKLINVL